MKTLLEFITFTKGIEYLIAIAFLFGFIAFWQLINYKGKGLIKRTAPLVAISLSFVALAFIIGSARTARAMHPVEGPLLASPVLADIYGPASFDHELHQKVVERCTLCHHHSEGSIPPCKECHAASNSEDLRKPSITHVFHLRCISCHMENQTGPTDCTGCHNEAVVPPLSIAHPLAGVENCIGCHGAGIPGVPALPADHAGATNGVCQLCHKVAVNPRALATRELPHAVAGREDCLMCHGEGIGGASKVPADHAGRTNDTCQLCHKPSPEATSSTSSQATPAPERAPSTPQGPSNIPHDVAGQEDCLACHKGEALPADHAGRTNDTCQLCHQPLAEGEAPSLAPSAASPKPGTIPHDITGRDDCLACHEEGGGRASKVPADHAGRTNDTCQLCHKPS